MENIPLGSSAPVGHHMHLLRDEQSCSPFQARSFGGHEVQSTHRMGSLQQDQVSTGVIAGPCTRHRVLGDRLALWLLCPS